MRRITVGITGMDSLENPYPGLAVASCLKAVKGADIHVRALTYEPTTTGIYCREAIDSVVLIPYPSDSETVMLSGYMKLQKENPIDVLIPALDSEIALYARIRNELDELGIRTLIPSERAVKSRAKTSLLHTCRRENIPTPLTEILNYEEQLDSIEQRFSFPLYIKGSIIDAEKAENLAEAKYFYRRILNDWGYPVIVQRRIVGDEYDIMAIADRDHKPLAVLPMRKFGITGRGKAFSGLALDSGELREYAERTLRKLQWVGPCELELMREASTGTYYLLEMNARFPAWVALCVKAGINFPYMTVCRALGMDLPESEYRPGALFFRNINIAAAEFSEFAGLASSGTISWKK